ncbi:amino acid adenylation domain-containing protein [Nocardia sp. NPDC020380]|uniref:amino acid adenylation domain-containing protein n=1 Tax=Nocardia sp. NPDC020380 TaxID=3364309 RepID=UPI00378A7570
MARVDGNLEVGGPGAATARAEPVQSGNLPLSDAQMRWWVAQQLYPGVPNTVAMYLDLRGPLDVRLLRSCAGRAAWEMQSPHVRFRMADGYPRQYLDPDAFEAMRWEDLSGCADPVRVALAAMDRDHDSPLDLLADRLTVAMLFRITAEQHLLYLRSHHIVLDGVGSAGVLRRTIELYAGAQDSAWPPLGRTAPAASHGPLTIAELLEDERAYADSPRAQSDREYWAREVAGIGEPARLAGRLAAGARPHRVWAEASGRTVQRLAALRHDSASTFPELLIAAFACYLAAMTGAADIVLTLPVTARPTAALRASAGSMSNVVPLRLRGIRDATVSDVIAQVRARVVGALRHQRCRYEDIQRGLGENHTVRGGFGPVVNAIRIPETPHMGGSSVQAHLLALGPVEDLLVNGYQFGPDEHSIIIGMQANPGLYSAETLELHHRRFLEYFEGFLADPRQAVRSLDPEPVAPSAVVPGTDRLLPDLLRARLIEGGRSGVADAVALQDGDRCWTYRELDEMSSRWARELIESGVGPGTFVLVAVPRSAESVLAVWAVAKTGAAFVPVDPADPARRLGAVAADSGALHGLTVTAVRAGLPAAVEWLALDDASTRARVQQRSGAPIRAAELLVTPSPDHPAYLIYTSGTTGTPKGVVVTHRGLGPLADYLVEHYGVDGNSRVLHAHAPSFDAHLLELLAAFAAGARLVVEPPEIVAGAELAGLLSASGITHFLTTPAVLATLDPAAVPDLRVAVVGGEACPADLVRRWAPHLRLYNGYGPTETTVMATQSDSLVPGGPVPIGPPLPGVRAMVLDARLQPGAPCGSGELYVGGPGVAQGYRGRPGATAERFVADPSGVGGRMYRTGDLVRSAPDGVLEFLGRADDQVSVRGRRAEPAEVEAALLALPGVVGATVTADDGPHGIRLVGYIVAAQGIRLDHADLIRQLRERLPAALVPAQLVDLDRLPVTAHGKVDRAALPAAPAVQRPYRAPESGLEQLVAARFAAATGRERVGLDDDFFELGGNSLLGVALSAELAAETGLPVTVRWLYTAPTAGELAARLAGHEGDSAGDDALGVVLTLRRKGTRPPLFCVHSAVPLAWCYSGLARHVPDRPVYGLQALTLAGEPQSGVTIDDLADGYVAEILRVQPAGPYHLLGWSLGGQIAHAIALRLRARGAAVETLAMLDSVVFPDDMPPPPVPRMRDLLTHLLGEEPENADELPDLTAEEAAAELASAAASFGTGLTADQLDRLHRGYMDGVRLSHGYEPGVFDGDLVYFSAARGVTESVGSDMWRPYVTGTLIEHPVAATHAQLTNADVVAVIGPLLAAHLDRAELR